MIGTLQLLAAGEVVMLQFVESTVNVVLSYFRILTSKPVIGEPLSFGAVQDITTFALET